MVNIKQRRYLCPLCRKNLIDYRTRRCRACFTSNKRSQLSRLTSNKRYMDKKRGKLKLNKKRID